MMFFCRKMGFKNFLLWISIFPVFSEIKFYNVNFFLICNPKITWVATILLKRCFFPVINYFLERFIGQTPLHTHWECNMLDTSSWCLIWKKVNMSFYAEPPQLPFLIIYYQIFWNSPSCSSLIILHCIQKTWWYSNKNKFD